MRCFGYFVYAEADFVILKSLDVVAVIVISLKLVSFGALRSILVWLHSGIGTVRFQYSANVVCARFRT